MSDSEPTALEVILGSKFFLLLAALVITFLVSPVLAEESRIGEALQLSCITFVFGAALYANRQRRWVFGTAVVIAAVALPLSWGTFFWGSNPMTIGRHVVSFLFLAFTAAMILLSVLRDYHATADAVVGAICVYLLIGFMWAMAYSAIECVEDDPFEIPYRAVHYSADDGRDLTDFAQLIYYSFVTMSTLGYGDITPRTTLAQTASWMQSVVGQFYLAILVARLVSVLPTPRKSE